MDISRGKFKPIPLVKHFDEDQVDEALLYMSETCVLDVVEKPTDSGNAPNVHMTLEEIGILYGITRERIRQILNTAMGKARPFLALHKKDFAIWRQD
jgi:hypothetical protein